MAGAGSEMGRGFAGVALVVVGMLGGTAPLAGQRQRESAQESAVRDLVAGAEAAGLALWGAYAPRDSARLQLVIAPRNDLPVARAWMGFGAVSHPLYYLVAECGGRLVPLGGFERPELDAAAPCVTSDSVGDARLRDLARKYARLVDSGGAKETLGMELVSNDTINPVAQIEWAERRPGNWPRDSVYRSAADERFVTLTTFTFKTRGAGAAFWQATAFTFVFREGRLHAWTRREGPILPWRPRLVGKFVAGTSRSPDER